MTRSVPEWIAKHDDEKIPPRVRVRVFDRYGGVCQLSGRKIQVGEAWECDHIRALINGGEHRESNLHPVLVGPHRAKTVEDVKAKSRAYRKRSKHIGAHESRNPLPFGRKSKWKRKLTGEVVER